MKVAVFSLFLNEYFFIPYWQHYYGNLFGYENLYVLGDLENDSSFKIFDRAVNKINYTPGEVDLLDHTRIALETQAKLLETHDVVIFAEADQFFFPDPLLYRDLNEYLEKNTQDYMRVSGWNVLHIPDSDCKFNPSNPILEQRTHWFKDPGPEDKMTIVRKPVEWYGTGFHDSRPTVARDNSLYNIHLHLCEAEQCNSRRHTKTHKMKWGANTGPGSGGGHVWIQDDAMYNTWLDYGLICGISEIPERFRIL